MLVACSKCSTGVCCISCSILQIMLDVDVTSGR
jgi:hypothetical protein